MMLRFFSWLSITALSFVACGQDSSKATKTEIKIREVDCYVRYVEAKRELQAELTLRSDTGTVAWPDGQVQFMNQVMTARTFPRLGTQYRLSLENIPADTLYRFSLVEGDGTEHHLDLPMNRIIRPTLASQGKISLEKGGLLTWEGRIFEPSDALTLTCFNPKNQDMSFNHIGLTRDPRQLELPGAVFKLLGLGEAQMQLVKKWSYRGDLGGFKVFQRSEFYFSPLNFSIVP